MDPVPRGLAPLDLAGTYGHLPGCAAPGGLTERHGRLTHPSMPCGSRMASTPGGGATNWENRGLIFLPPLRMRNVSKAALALRRVLTRLELSTRVGLSADTSPAHSSQEDQNRPGPSHPSGSGLGKQTMASRNLCHAAQLMLTHFLTLPTPSRPHLRGCLLCPWSGKGLSSALLKV